MTRRTCANVLVAFFGLHSCPALPLSEQRAIASGELTACVPNQLREGDKCKIAWADLQPILHPTQAAVGWAWINSKWASNMRSKADAQDRMDATPIPVCKGPNELLYAIDCHHDLCSLDLSGYRSVKVTIVVTCDYGTLPVDQFWSQMNANDMVYLGKRNAPTDLPQPSTYEDLPTRLYFSPEHTSFADDPWRSIAGFSRKLKDGGCPSSNKYCMRAFDRICASAGGSITHFEFRWGYFFNAGYLNRTLWPDAHDHGSFVKSFDDLPTTKVGKDASDDWLKTAGKLWTLARSWAAQSFVVPYWFGNIGGPLPGVVYGTGQIKHKDATCDLPTCPNANARLAVASPEASMRYAASSPLQSLKSS